MTATTTYTCPYCRIESAGVGTACPMCGAPVDVALRTTSGGWLDVPPIASMTRLQAGRSTVQIEGAVCSSADWNLAEGDGVYFPHHTVLWQDPSIRLEPKRLARQWTRHRAGLPMMMAQATGPGHIAFSHHSPGEIMAIPLQAGHAVDVCEGKLLVATANIDYDWGDSGVYYTTSGRQAADIGAGAGLLRMGMNMIGDEDERKSEETEWHYPMGRYLDRFTARDQPGLVMIGVAGNAYVRTLADGESLLVKPPAVLFKDPTVAAQLHVEYPSAGMAFWRSWGNRYLWLRLHGPGRVGIESNYENDQDPGTDFGNISQHTRWSW